MFYDIDQVTILKAAIKVYGQGVQIGNLIYLDSVSHGITVMLTPINNRSIKGIFYYKKGSFDAKDKDLDLA